MLCFKGGKSQSPQAGQFNSYKQEPLWRSLWSRVSQSPQAGQFNSYRLAEGLPKCPLTKSQSPQAGQFNSYEKIANTLLFQRKVSIPSSGSIQFLPA